MRTLRKNKMKTAFAAAIVLLYCPIVCQAAEEGTPQAPLILEIPAEIAATAEYSVPVGNPDGNVDLYFSRTTAEGKDAVRCRSGDNGQTWSEPETVYSFALSPKQKWVYPFPMLLQSGRLQLFWLVDRRSGNNPGVDYLIDIWNVHTKDATGANNVAGDWSEKRRIFAGYVGSINGWTQLSGGRIVLPFAYWRGGVPAAPPIGNNYVTCLYSDDEGRTWKQSPAKLATPCEEDYNGENTGAVEPCVIELADGRVWMLIRTQTGRLYESFSADGVQWSEASPTQFYSSDAPAALVRVPDGRIVVFWNNCQNTSRIEGRGVYTNRDALHAAVSRDEGKTWHGFREVLLDPLRNVSEGRFADRGTAYPYPTVGKHGKIIMATGQAAGSRKLLRIDPDWLEQTSAADDFSGGLKNWSVYKCYGLPERWWRPRTAGARLIDLPIDHPSKAGARVLHVRRPDEKPGDEAVWNFPAGRSGEVEIDFSLQSGCKDIAVALADRYIQPNDEEGREKELFRLSLAADGKLPDGSKLVQGQWHKLAMRWNLHRGICELLIDGRPAGSLVSLHEEPAGPGISYLRLRSTAPAVDAAGFVIEKVRANITP